MLNKHDEDNLDENRLTLNELKKFKEFKNISDEHGEELISKLRILASIILE